MNRTHLWLLIAVLGLASFYTWGKYQKLIDADTEYQSKRYFPHKEQKDIESISVVCTDPKFAYVLKRNSDRWYLDGHLASQEKSPQLVDSVITLGTEREVKANSKPEDDKEYGFDEPTYTFTLTGNGGVDLGTVILGDRTPGANHFYGRWQKGGAISTVPAYMFSPLEEEPEKLREMSPFPVEAAAVDRLEFKAGDKISGKLERPKDAKEGFVFSPSSLGAADETRVTGAIYLLKDMKVARFLSEKESTNLGPIAVSYRAHEAESTVDFVTELNGPVSVNPKLRYGRRYLTEPGKSEALAGTDERFVIEMTADSKALSLTAEQFEDRRVAKVDVDKVKVVDLKTDQDKLKVRRLPQGGWGVLEPEGRAQEANLASRIDKLLWALRDLRYVDSKAAVTPAGASEWSLNLEISEGDNLKFRFGTDKTGKPFVGFEDKLFLIQEELAPALDDAVKALAAPTKGGGTPK